VAFLQQAPGALVASGDDGGREEVELKKKKKPFLSLWELFSFLFFVLCTRAKGTHPYGLQPAIQTIHPQKKWRLEKS